MSKLLIKPFGFSNGNVCELEQAKHLNYKEIVLVDGRRVRSYDELMQLVTQDNYKTKEFIEVVLIPSIAGG
jgi:hypothetical protein